MHHYFEAITNKSGDSLPGYFARVVDPATQNTVTLAADNNGTPIVTTSGVENAAKTDENGNISFYVPPGTYHLDIYAQNATSFIMRVPNVAMNSGQGPQGDPGPAGEPGTINAFGTLAALLASPTSRQAAQLVPQAGETAPAGDFKVINGVWQRQAADGISFKRPASNATTQPTSTVLASYEVTPEQFGAIGDGVADDAPAIQRALDYIKSLATSVPGQVRPGSLLFTAGRRYKCGSGLVCDARYHNLFGYAILDFSSWTGVYIQFKGSYSDSIFGNGYGQNGCMDGQIVIYGSGAGNASVGIRYESDFVFSSTHIRTIGVTVANCGVAFQIGARGYNQEFINCKSLACDIIFDWLGLVEDNDERISVFGGTFYNSRLFLRHYRPGACFYVHSASIDYTQKIVECVTGKVQFFGVHVESNRWLDCPIDVSGNGGQFLMIGGWFLMQSNLGNLTNYVRVGAGSMVKFENIITNNTNNTLTPDAQTPTTWAIGDGRFEMHHIEPAFEFGGMPARQHASYSLLSDGDFDRPLGEDLIFIERDTILGTDPATARYTGQNLQLTRVTTNQYNGTGCLRLDKQFGATSPGAIILMAIPVAWGDKMSAGFRVRTAPDRSGLNSMLIISGGWARFDGLGPDRRPVITRIEGPGSQNISPPTDNYTLVTINNTTSQSIAPSWATHFVVEIETSPAHQASWLFDGMWVNRG